jgi:hypothetical protein
MKIALSGLRKTVASVNVATITVRIIIGSLFFSPVIAYADAAFDAQAVINGSNQDRIAQGVSPLVENATLSRAAQKKAEDMIARGYFSHVGPDGAQPWDWFTKAGYRFSNAGENLALGYSDVSSLEAGWMNSPGHRKNILNKTYTNVGVGIAHGNYKGTKTTIVVQFFGKPYASSQKTIAKAADTVVQKQTSPQLVITKPTAVASHLVQTSRGVQGVMGSSIVRIENVFK